MQPRLLFILLFFVGLGMFIYSLSLDYYTDEVAIEKLNAESYTMERSDYYKQRSELRTNKNYLMDWGAGVAIAAATVWSFLFICGVEKWKGLLLVKTLGWIGIFIGSNAAWLMLLLGSYWYYGFRLERGDYPPFADSIGIPLGESFVFFLLMFIPLNIFLFVTSIGANLPKRLFAKARSYKSWAIIWEVFFGLFILLNLIVSYYFIKDGDHLSIPVNLFFTYVLLSLRAGQVSRF